MASDDEDLGIMFGGDEIGVDLGIIFGGEEIGVDPFFEEFLSEYATGGHADPDEFDDHGLGGTPTRRDSLSDFEESKSDAEPDRESADVGGGAAPGDWEPESDVESVDESADVGGGAAPGDWDSESDVESVDESADVGGGAAPGDWESESGVEPDGESAEVRGGASKKKSAHRGASKKKSAHRGARKDNIEECASKVQAALAAFSESVW